MYPTHQSQELPIYSFATHPVNYLEDTKDMNKIL